MSDYDSSVPAFMPLLLGFALLALVAWAYLQALPQAYPENEVNAFITRSNNALAPVIGADRVPLMPNGITVVVGQGVLGRSASEFEYSAFKELERGAIKTSGDVYYKIVVNSQPGVYYSLFKPNDLQSFGYKQSSVAGAAGKESKAFWTRVFSSGDAAACRNDAFSVSDAVKLCVWTECAAKVCIHSFFNCGGTRVDWLLESGEALKQTALNTNEEVKAAFAEVC